VLGDEIIQIALFTPFIAYILFTIRFSDHKTNSRKIGGTKGFSRSPLSEYGWGVGFSEGYFA
jgi:hypothetical protein